MGIKITVDELIRGIKEDAKSKLVCLSFDNGFDSSFEKHPLEKYLAREGIPYYFKGDGIGKKEDYVIDLSQIDILYTNNFSQEA